ncbi:MAG: Ig-like domain-containing protein [Gammaproteobacteria bacterium]|nr:Ig-like domain-containing protein [Gammaproteobacteria bacterium]
MLITAIVRNASNNVVANVPVALSADSGALLVTQGTTDANGTATAELTNGLDPTNRIITVTATAGITQTLSIAVVGTTLSLTGPPALALNSTGQFTASLKDSAGAGISGISVAFTSANGNVVSPPTRTTNASGSADGTLTAGTAGSGGGDTVTATAMGMTATADVSISGDSFAFIAPAPNSEVILNTGQVVQLQWLQNGNPVPNGSVVQFSTTRGSVSGVLPTAGGVAQATITSSTAGSAIVTARDPVSNTTATLNIEFVATNPASLDLSGVTVHGAGEWPVHADRGGA